MLDEPKTIADRFQPNQIVCLEHQNNFLYCEVIQLIPERQLCWVRPLILVLSLAQSRNLMTADLIFERELIDVRSLSDLIFPLLLFRPALDTEMIPFYCQIEELSFLSDNTQNSRYKLHQFIKQVWRDKPDIFRKIKSSS